MGLFHHSIEVGDPQGIRFERVEALVDTGATFTLVPSSLLQKLGVEAIRRSTFVLADGREVEKEIGQTWVQIDGRSVITMVIFGDEEEEPLLGAYTLEGLLLGVDPAGQRLVPTRGWLASSKRKGQPMQAKRMSNGGPTMRGVARLTGSG